MNISIQLSRFQKYFVTTHQAQALIIQPWQKSRTFHGHLPCYPACREMLHCCRDQEEHKDQAVTVSLNQIIYSLVE